MFLKFLPFFLLIVTICGCSKSNLKTAEVKDTFLQIEVKDTFLQNKVVAHRGAWLEYGLPENSMASLKKAIEIGCEASEFDVHLTADKVLVINHDPTFFNLTIEKLTYKDLLTKKLSNGESIPTVKEYISEAMKQGKTKLMLEPKASVVSKSRSLEMADSIVSLVNRMDAGKWMIYISFDSDILKRIRSLEPGAEIQYLSGNLKPAELKDINISMDYNYGKYRQNLNWIKEAKNFKVITNSWTVNNKTDMQWLLDLNIEMITTDYPAMLLKLL